MSRLTFQQWHEAAGYTVTFMARCDRRYFALLYKAWDNSSDPKLWAGRAHDEQPWN